MPTIRITKALGLYTDPNQLDLPKGAYVRAENAVVDRNGVLQCRRGFDAQPAMPAPTTAVHKLFAFNSFLWAHRFDGTNYKISSLGGGVWTTLSGSYAPPDAAQFKMRFAEAQGLLYFTTSQGVQKQGTTGSPTFAGSPKAIGFDRDACTTPDVAAGIIAPQKQVAYRNVLMLVDALGKEYPGSPSGRLILRNTNAAGGSNKAPTIRSLLPKQNGTSATALTTSYKIQLFRSSASADLSSEPLEDEALVYERFLVAGDITNGYVDVTDVTPDSLRGPFLYTSVNQEGIAQANEPPPYAKELVPFKGCMFYLNTIGRQRLLLQLISTDATNGLKANETINIGGVTFTAKAAPAVAGEYKLEVTSATISVSQAVALTAQSLVGAINKHASNTSIWAYYVADPSDPRTVGQILLENRLNADTSFNPYVGVAHTQACWEPQLPQGGGTSAAVSTADIWANGVLFSKPDQPEAVPLLNALKRLGSANSPIIAAKALRDSIFVFKDDGTVYRILGEPPTAGNPGTFRVEDFSQGLLLRSPDTLVQLAERLFGWFDQGVCSITESAVTPHSSINIKKTLLAIEADAGLAAIRENAFAIASETDGRYILFTPDRAGDTVPVQAWSFGVRSAAWTKWPSLTRSCGLVFNDFIYLGDAPGALAKAYKESKTRSGADFDDDGVAIPFLVEWAPLTDGQPDVMKHYSMVTVMLGETSSPSLTFTFLNEFGITAAVTVAVTSRSAICPVPDSVSRCARLQLVLNFATVGADPHISALSVEYRKTGDKVTV